MSTQTISGQSLESSLNGVQVLHSAIETTELYGALDRLKKLQEQGRPLPACPGITEYTYPQKIAIYKQMDRVLELVGERRPR